MVAEIELQEAGKELPLRILNILNMKRYDFAEIKALANLWYTLAGDLDPHTRAEKLNSSQIESIRRHLDGAMKRLTYLELGEAAKYTRTIYNKLGTFQCETQQQYSDQAWVLMEIALNELDGHIFGFIPKSHGAYFAQDALFGPEVNTEFADAVVDIKEAGNCYALGRYTACVFHLMRVLEIALHKVAKDLAVTFPAAIELENWQNIIEKIESAIRDKEKLPKGTYKSEELQYYSEAAKEFRYFKDAWRNHVSHSRVEYEIHDATKIMEHVRDFMQHLATR